MEPIRIIPIEALFDEGVGPNLAADPRRALAEVDVIYGVDVMSQRRFLVYGLKTLERILRTGRQQLCNVMFIGLDQETEELEKPIALVRLVKGDDDYRAGKA